MDTEQLQGIRERLDEFRREDGDHGLADAVYMITRDVPALLAEVDRLRGAVREHQWDREDHPAECKDCDAIDTRLWSHLD